MALVDPVDLYCIAARIGWGTRAHQIPCILEFQHFLEYLISIRFLIRLQLNLLRETPSHIRQSKRNLPPNNILISSIQFCISFLNNVTE